MVTEETLKTHEMELESRIRNLVWTVSGDYTLKLNPDVERYAKEPDTVLYDTIRQGAFSCYFEREAYSLYLVKKVYSGAAEGELMMLAQLVTEEAVSKRLESERPGVKGFRRRAAEEILDHSFESLSKNETCTDSGAWTHAAGETEYFYRDFIYVYRRNSSGLSGTDDLGCIYSGIWQSWSNSCDVYIDGYGSFYLYVGTGILHS